MKSLKKLLFSSDTSDYAFTIIASFFHAFALFIYGIFARHEIAPLYYGIFTTANLFSTYMGFAQLGVLNSFNRDYPQAVGAKDEDRKKRLISTTFWYLTILYAVLGIAVTAVMFLLNKLGRVSTDLFFGVALICVSVFLSHISTLFAGILKSDGHYKKSALTTIFVTVARVASGAVFILTMGHVGLYISLICSAIAGIIINIQEFKRVKFIFDFPLIKTMFLFGIPLLVNSLVWSLNASMDQFVILGFSTQEVLGIYSVAQTVFSVMMLVPQSISQVQYVKLSNLYGKTNDKTALLEKTADFSTLLSWSSGAIAAIGIVCLPTFVRFFMPQYVDGIFPAQILCVGVAFYGATMLYGNIFSVLKENSKLLFTSILLCVINLAVSVGLVLIFGFNLYFVGIGTSFSYLAYSIILIALLSHYHKLNFVRAILKICLPTASLLLPVIPVAFISNNEIFSIIFATVWVVLVSILFYFYKKRGK